MAWEKTSQDQIQNDLVPKINRYFTDYHMYLVRPDKKVKMHRLQKLYNNL